MRPGISQTDLNNLKDDQGIIGRATTATLFVSPNGDNTDGTSWNRAYTSINGALDAASTDVNECTLIMVGINTGDNNYDINVTGDPTWTGNYVLKGTHRTWAKIKNTHASATSIMKFTGNTSLIDLNFNLGTGSVNGVIMTHGAFRVRSCQFAGLELTGAATALHVDGATVLKHGIIERCDFLGHVTHMAGLILNNVTTSNIHYCDFHKCLTGVQIINADSDSNNFSHLDVGDCAIGLDFDAGNEQHLDDINFHGNTLNIDDEVGDHIYNDLRGAFNTTTEPDNFAGVSVNTGDGANLWGADTEIRAAVTSTVPFRIVSLNVETDASEKYRIRLTADGGSTYFADFQFEGVAAGINSESLSFASGTEYIFNKGVQIKASVKSESVGVDNALVWLEIQEI